MRRAVLLLSTLVLVLAAAAAGVPRAQGASSTLVVSQVYAGGGNAGATYQNDFVELFNRGAVAVDLTGWTVQYAPATGTSWQATTLTGSVAPGRYFLVQLASTAAVGGVLPLANATGTTNLAASGGKVALVHDLTALTCGASAGSCSTLPTIQDLVGYGSAADFEGTAAVGALSSTTAALRGLAGCADTDQNAVDFTVAPPDPRNGSTATVSCTTSTPPEPTATQAASVDLDVQPVISISLEHPTLSFGQGVSGTTPPSLSERVTVFSNRSAGYSLSVHRSPFSPADLPLGIASTAATGGVLAPALVPGSLVPIPVAPAVDLLIGTTSAPSAAAGDAWPATVGFTGPLPAVAPGHYTGTVTFTVIGR